jgi:hypothetical protein
MASPLSTLFPIEGILKIIGGSIFILYPSTILKNLQEPPYPATSLSLIRSLGTQTIAFSIPLFLAAKSRQPSVKRGVYLTLLGREGLLALGLFAQIGWSFVAERYARKGGPGDDEIAALEEGNALEIKGRRDDQQAATQKWRRGSWFWIAELVPFIMGRIWILTRRDIWFT